MLADSTTREDSAVKRSKGIVLTFFFFFFFFLYHTSLTLEKHLFGPVPSFTGL